MLPEDARSTLQSAASQLGLVLSNDQLTAMLSHLTLLEKWNRVYNLTAVRDPAAMLHQHLIDSLAAAPPLGRQLAVINKVSPRLLDVGSGGGLPGVVLAITFPHLSVTCVDTVGKKASFVQQVAAELQLGNLKSAHARVEALAPADCDVITSRAFASLTDFVTLTRRHLTPNGVWMALKGKTPMEEMANLPADAEVFHVEQLTVPGLDAERCIVWIKPR